MLLGQVAGSAQALWKLEYSIRERKYSVRYQKSAPTAAASAGD
ncbi:MAG: hypothetical protein O3A93_11855 [Chloroflexi bacterium]|nr:hypothetical protein [Chloroflexota bacterium]MDA1271931.1 hypothetical protein [Chloroflexota bacterium]